MKRWKITAAAAVGAVVAFLGVTWRALEGGEVVILRTFDAAGAAHEARTWIAEEDGFLWIEAADRQRPFYRNVLVNPSVELVRDGHTRRYRAVPIASPDGHERIRRLLAAKYGWADHWIALLADTSQSVAIRLEPPAATGTGDQS